MTRSFFGGGGGAGPVLISARYTDEGGPYVLDAGTHEPLLFAGVDQESADAEDWYGDPALGYWKPPAGVYQFSVNGRFQLANPPADTPTPVELNLRSNSNLPGFWQTNGLVPLGEAGIAFGLTSTAIVDGDQVLWIRVIVGAGQDIYANVSASITRLGDWE